MTSISLASSRRKPAVLMPGNHPGVVHVDAGMKLLSGTLCSESRDWYEEPLERGLKLVLVQSGQLRCRVPGQPEQCIKGPGLCLIANDGEFTTQQIYSWDAPLRYTIVQLGIDALDRGLSLLPEKLLAPTGGDPRIVSCPASKALQALAAQIATCPFEGAVRDYYLTGKAFELTALSAQLVSTQRAPTSIDVRITSSDIERVYAASGILTRDLQAPPTLDALCARVGMNPRKLTAGFARCSARACTRICRNTGCGPRTRCCAPRTRTCRPSRTGSATVPRISRSRFASATAFRRATSARRRTRTATPTRRAPRSKQTDRRPKAIDLARGCE